MTSLVLVLAACSTGLDANARPSTIPADAPEIENDVYHLGTGLDPATGDDIEGFAFVHRVLDAEHAIEPDSAGPTAGLGCYTLGRFNGWTEPEPWGLDGANSSGLSDADIQATLEDGQDVWEEGADADIFGSFDSSLSGIADATFDEVNNVAFGDAGGGSTLAITFIWGRTSGTAALIEWDQIYDDRFDWTVGDPVGSDAYDLLDVVAHELGHAAGLKHPATTDECRNQTMYKHVPLGETKKRTLENGDRQGIRAIY